MIERKNIMEIKLTNEEINRTALGMFVDMCQNRFKRRSDLNLMESVYEQAQEFAYSVPHTHVHYDVLKWVSGEKGMPIDKLLCWCNRWLYKYKDNLSTVMNPDKLVLQTIASEVQFFLQEQETAEDIVFSKEKFLVYRFPCELNGFLKAYMLMIERRHSKIWASDVQQLLAYGYAKGVHAERQRRSRKQQICS